MLFFVQETPDEPACLFNCYLESLHHLVSTPHFPGFAQGVCLKIFFLWVDPHVVNTFLFFKDYFTSSDPHHDISIICLDAIVRSMLP